MNFERVFEICWLRKYPARATARYCVFSRLLLRLPSYICRTYPCADSRRYYIIDNSYNFYCCYFFKIFYNEFRYRSTTGLRATYGVFVRQQQHSCPVSYPQRREFFSNASTSPRNASHPRSADTVVRTGYGTEDDSATA
jgi:hypothetical protein